MMKVDIAKTLNILNRYFYILFQLFFPYPIESNDNQRTSKLKIRDIYKFVLINIHSIYNINLSICQFPPFNFLSGAEWT